MARFKKIRRAAKRAGRYVKRSYSRGQGAGQIFQLDAMAYGALRAPIATQIMAYVPRFAGDATDEVVMGVVDWAAAKYIKGGFIGSMARKGLVVENARVGELVAQKGLSLFSGGTADQSNSQSW